MNTKVALLALLAVFSAVNAQNAVALVAQSALGACATSASGCGILSVLASGGLTALIGGALDFSAYNNVAINFDQAGLGALTIGSITVGGTGNTVNVASGVTVNANNLAVAAGNTLQLAGTASAVIQNNVQASGAIVIGAGASIKVAAGGAAGVIYQNAASLNASAGAQIDSSIQVASGAAAYVGDQASSTAAQTVISGTFVVNGAVNFGNTQVAGAVTAGSSASASAAANIAVTVSAVANFQSTFTASTQATVTVNTGAAIIVAGNVQSQGQVVVAGAINVTSTVANYVQQASASGSANVASNLQLNGGSVNVAAGANIQLDGSLGGQGTLTGTLTGSGTLNIGNSPGTVFVRGDYKPGLTSTFNLEIASDISYDKLVVSGTATLNGGLHVITLNGYNPPEKQRYTFLTANQVTGQYVAVTGEGNNIAKWTQSETSNSAIVNYNSAVTVAVSGLLVVACLLASLL